MNDPVATEGRKSLLSWRRGPFGVPGCAILVLLAATLPACQNKSSKFSGGATGQRAMDDPQVIQRLLAQTVHNLNEVSSSSSDGAGQQTIDRLNQWSQSQKVDANWKVDPMAAPIVAAAADIAEKLKPINESLRKPAQELELKNLARQFEIPVIDLDRLSQRRSLGELMLLDRRCEEFLHRRDAAIKEFSSTEQLDEVEQKVLEKQKRRYREPAKADRFGRLLALAQQLDFANRLTDPSRLMVFAQATEMVAREWDQTELTSAVDALLADNRSISGPLRSKTVLAIAFVAELTLDTAALKDLAELKRIGASLEPLAEYVKSTGRRVDRDDVAALAPKIDAARKQMDLAELKNLLDQMNSLAKPRDLGDYKNFASAMKGPARQLRELSALAEAAGKRLELQNLQLLGRYIAQLSGGANTAVELFENPIKLIDRLKADPSMAKAMEKKLSQINEQQKTDAAMVFLADQFITLSGQVDRLTTELEYFATLGSLEFPPIEQRSLQQAVILRDLSRWIRGEEADDLTRAKRMFDWTVRNIQLDPEYSGRIMQFPLETLMFGKASATERAWVFLLLCRQQHLDAAILGIEDSQNAGQRRIRPWAIGVLSEGKIYVFDPMLGCPIPGPSGPKLDESGQLSIEPATLAQLQADDSLFRRLDADKEHLYPITAAMAKKTVALVEASPSHLARRMQLIEAQLAGDEGMVLSVSPSAQAERFLATKVVTSVGLWTTPFETIFHRSWRPAEASQWLSQMMLPFDTRPIPALQLGRTLHMRGKLLPNDSEPGAATHYQNARPSDRELEALRRNDPQDVRPLIFQAAKQNASFWLGLMAFDQGNFTSAEDYFKIRTLAAWPRPTQQEQGKTLMLGAWPRGAWTAGAKYNLGRVYEATGKYRQALEQYVGDTESADYGGILLRAKWLAALTKTPLPELKKSAPPEKPAAAGKGGVPELPTLPGLNEPTTDKKPAEKKSEAKKPEPKAESNPAAKPEVKPEAKPENAPKSAAPAKLPPPTEVKPSPKAELKPKS